MQTHYNYAFDSITQTYNFTTTNNILYRVAFVVDETFTSLANETVPNVYQLIIEKASDEIEPLDLRVSKTIEHIVDSFFQNVFNSIIFVCSSENDKDLKRFKVFDRWYQKSKHKHYIYKIDHVILISIVENVPQKIYTSLMFHKDNPTKDQLVNLYNLLETILREEK